MPFSQHIPFPRALNLSRSTDPNSIVTYSMSIHSRKFRFISTRRQFQLIISFVFLLAAIVRVSADTNTTSYPPERYELCKSDAEIKALQQMYGLINVSSTSTNAALHPGWPQTLFAIVTGISTILLSMRSNLNFASVSALLPPIVVYIAWIYSFALIEREKATGGWISVFDWTLTSVLVFWALYFRAISGRSNTLTAILITILALMTLFQLCGSAGVLIQRSTGRVGSLPYIISNDNGCIPTNGFEYLQQGARSHIFRVIQTIEFFYSFFVLWVMVSYTRSQTYWAIKQAAPLYLFFIYIPVLVYEIIIATKGRPVVISGNCMLVELDPRFGFLDSEIETLWKVISGISGL